MLYHGTDASNVASIRKDGLKSWLYGEYCNVGTLTASRDLAASYDNACRVPIGDGRSTYPVILQFELGEVDFKRYVKKIGRDEFGLNEPLPGRFLKRVIDNPRNKDHEYYISKRGARRSRGRQKR